jgi:hypothetical protein
MVRLTLITGFGSEKAFVDAIEVCGTVGGCPGCRTAVSTA